MNGAMTLQEIRLDPCRVCNLPHAYHVNPVERVGRTTCERDLELWRSPPSWEDFERVGLEFAIGLAEEQAIRESFVSSQMKNKSEKKKSKDPRVKALRAEILDALARLEQMEVDY